MRPEEKLFSLLKEKNLTMSCAESISGGLISKRMTDISGVSACFCGGAVTYTNDVKMRVLGVDAAIIEQYSEVSFECAKAMAENVKELYRSDVSVSTTGYAGPTGKKIGLVYIGICANGKTDAYEFNFSGDREEIRRLVADSAIRLLIDALM
ncbi:MAG: CinA family protein [Clostridia bacterium]|nr:CinA family protein [Clostridia bacterium]